MKQPDITFDHLGIAPNMMDILEKMKIVSPTPIQHKAIPVALEGKDIVGIAQTGTGKTLAFGVPLIQRLAAENGVALILEPTRDLALQVDEALEKILGKFQMKSAVLIGGMPIHEQIKELRQDPQVIIATPGRMIDHLERHTVDLRMVTVLVLDEADRMLDMGFAPQVERILRGLYKTRQTMLFSATMPPDIVKLASSHMKLPVHIEMAPSGTAAKDVSQELFIVKEDVKKRLLKVLLKQYRGPVLVFTRTKIKARRVARMVAQMRERVIDLHSDRSMPQRQQAIDGFKNGRYRVLVATDIAARGIDISKIELVVNFDIPDDPENYVHRIGRTGRAGLTGHAVTFATPDQGDDVARIERLIRKPLPRGKRQEVPTQKFEKSSGSSGGRKPPKGRSSRSGPRRRPSGRRKNTPRRK